MKSGCCLEGAVLELAFIMGARCVAMLSAVSDWRNSEMCAHLCVSVPAHMRICLYYTKMRHQCRGVHLLVYVHILGALAPASETVHAARPCIALVRAFPSARNYKPRAPGEICDTYHAKCKVWNRGLP